MKLSTSGSLTLIAVLYARQVPSEQEVFQKDCLKAVLSDKSCSKTNSTIDDHPPTPPCDDKHPENCWTPCSGDGCDAPPEPIKNWRFFAFSSFSSSSSLAGVGWLVYSKYGAPKKPVRSLSMVRCLPAETTSLIVRIETFDAPSSSSRPSPRSIPVISSRPITRPVTSKVEVKQEPVENVQFPQEN